MTLPASGSISMSQVRTELGASGQISLGQTNVRTLAGVASGVIGLSNLRGKTAASTLTGSAVTTTNDKDTQFGTGTFTGYGAVSVSGGGSSKTYTWTVTSNPSGLTMGSLNTATPSASKTYSRYESGTHTVTLTCVISDGTNSVTVTGNQIVLTFFDGRQ